MDFKTQLVYQAAKLRLRKIERYTAEAEDLQRAQLRHILSRARGTELGERYDLGRATDYKDFAQRLPFVEYDAVKGDIERMIRGERDVLIPGGCRWYAKSSGTTSDRSKYIPVPYLHLQDCHYRGGSDALWVYLRNYPDSRFFSTKGLVLGGSHSPMSLGSQASVGDLSAILVEHMPLLGNWLRVPSRETLLKSEWNAKMSAIVREVAQAPVGSLSGVPSWMLVLLRQLLEYTGAADISELWPQLEVFFHGGISFSPYRSIYRELIPSPRMRYEETYNASEGFFAIQDDPSESGMLLMLDYGVFYEFIPMDELEYSAEGSVAGHVRAVPLWEVEQDRDYALVITTLGGLYRYLIGDTVRFTSTAPYRIVITGRTKHFINAFGEELMVTNTDTAIARTTEHTGVQVAEYTVAPHFLLDEGKGYHDWMIEFVEPPSDLAAYARILDEELRRANSDYDAKRYDDMTLLPLQLEPAPAGLFHHWLEEQGKLGGQHKVPRLSSSRHYLEELLELKQRLSPAAPQL